MYQKADFGTTDYRCFKIMPALVTGLSVDLGYTELHSVGCTEAKLPW